MKLTTIAVVASILAYALGTWLQGQLTIAAAVIAAAGR